MQVFKAALRLFSKHPFYIAIYVVWLSFMGVFIGMSNVDDAQAEFSAERPDIAVIDRDRSELSQALGSFLGNHGTLIEIDDTRQAMQDATAQNRASYILVIPEGFGREFQASAQNGGTRPMLETVVSHESVAANMMNGIVDDYLGTAWAFLTSQTASSQTEAVSLTESAMVNAADAVLVEKNLSGPAPSQWILYMQFSAYTIMLSIIISIGIVLSGFNRTDVRRRNLVAPTSSLSMNLQLVGASIVIMLLAWAWVGFLGLVVFGPSLANVEPAIIALALAVLLAFCTVPLAIGFLLGQLATSEPVLNAAGNITALVMSFLGGVWLSLDIMGDDIAALAHFMPTYYYGNALTETLGLRDVSLSSLAPILGDMGILLLFAAAIFATALVAGRIRVQSSDAGGNAAAERVSR